MTGCIFLFPGRSPGGLASGDGSYNRKFYSMFLCHETGTRENPCVENYDIEAISLTLAANCFCFLFVLVLHAQFKRNQRKVLCTV